MPSTSESKKNPKILLVGSLSESSKLDLFINHEKCIKHQHSKNHQLGHQPAMGIQLNTLRFQHKNRIISLDLWNMIIQFQRYDQLASIYFDNVQAIVGVCQMSNPATFQRMKYWLNKFREQNSSLNNNVYMLACENDPTIRFISMESSSAEHSSTSSHVSRTQIIDYGHQIQAKIYIIRQYSRGRDLNKFFNDFLNHFWSSNLDQRLFHRIMIPSLFTNFICCK